MILVGEIGIPRDTFLYDLKWWEVKCIIRGYNRRHRDLWSSARWSTYSMMRAFAGDDKLAEAGIHGPGDILKLPWDKTPLPPISQEEKEELQAEMDAINAANNDEVNPAP